MIASARPPLARATMVATGDIIVTSSQPSPDTCALIVFSKVHASPPSVVKATLGSAKATHEPPSHPDRSSMHQLMPWIMEAGIEVRSQKGRVGQWAMRLK